MRRGLERLDMVDIVEKVLRQSSGDEICSKISRGSWRGVEGRSSGDL